MENLENTENFKGQEESLIVPTPKVITTNLLMNSFMIYS